MFYALIGEDAPDSLAARMAARPAHLARLEALRDEGRLLIAGPMPAIDSPDPGPAGFAGSLVVDRFRRRSIEEAYLETLAARPEPTAISPEERTLIIETLLAIDRTLDDFGPRTRAVFLLAQFEGLTYAAIGERLGISVTSVKKHLTRALTQCLILSEV